MPALKNCAYDAYSKSWKPIVSDAGEGYRRQDIPTPPSEFVPGRHSSDSDSSEEEQKFEVSPKSELQALVVTKPVPMAPLQSPIVPVAPLQAPVVPVAPLQAPVGTVAPLQAPVVTVAPIRNLQNVTGPSARGPALAGPQYVPAHALKNVGFNPNSEYQIINLYGREVRVQIIRHPYAGPKERLGNGGGQAVKEGEVRVPGPDLGLKPASILDTKGVSLAPKPTNPLKPNTMAQLRGPAQAQTAEVKGRGPSSVRAQNPADKENVKATEQTIVRQAEVQVKKGGAVQHPLQGPARAHKQPMRAPAPKAKAPRKPKTASQRERENVRRREAAQRKRDEKMCESFEEGTKCVADQLARLSKDQVGVSVMEGPLAVGPNVPKESAEVADLRNKANMLGKRLEDLIEDYEEFGRHAAQIHSGIIEKTTELENALFTKPRLQLKRAKLDRVQLRNTIIRNTLNLRNFRQTLGQCAKELAEDIDDDRRLSESLANLPKRRRL